MLGSERVEFEGRGSCDCQGSGLEAENVRPWHFRVLGFRVRAFVSVSFRAFGP